MNKSTFLPDRVISIPWLAFKYEGVSLSQMIYSPNASSRACDNDAHSHTPSSTDAFKPASDAACSGNPGDMEYRGVYTATGQEIFHIGPLKEGTNNVGEFLALVHGLALLQQKGSDLPIYSDSRNAISWVKKKKCKTLLARKPINEPIFDLIERAEKWLNTHTYTTQILKWETSVWGEIPADFGRK